MSNENSNESNRLEELGGSNFKIAEGQPNIKGWTVKDGNSQTVGEVDELIFDPETRQVRYIVLDLEGNVFDLDTRDVLVPIGLAELDENDDEVILPNITEAQLRALPDYDHESFSEETEHHTSQVFSGMGLAGAAITGGHLYDSDHFNEDNLYKRRQNTSERQTVSGIFGNGVEAQNAITEQEQSVSLNKTTEESEETARNTEADIDRLNSKDESDSRKGEY